MGLKYPKLYEEIKSNSEVIDTFSSPFYGYRILRTTFIIGGQVRYGAGKLSVYALEEEMKEKICRAIYRKALKKWRALL